MQQTSTILIISCTFESKFHIYACPCFSIYIMIKTSKGGNCNGPDVLLDDVRYVSDKMILGLIQAITIFFVAMEC